MEDKKENLISIDEVIRRAKNLGVDFGKGDPRNRLRYYVKIGLLPHAKRKVFKNKFPEGAYPEEIVWKLFEIDRMIKAGKGILQIKKELEEREKREKEEKEKEKEKISILPRIEKEIEEVVWKLFEIDRTIKTGKSVLPIREEKEKEEVFAKKAPKFSFLKLLSIFFAIFFAIYFLGAKFNFQKSVSYFLATVAKNFGKIVQAPTQVETKKETLEFPEVEPYLTINAETAIKGSLDVRDTVSSPIFVMKRETYNATLATAPLTADRTYTFPDQSGTVCLSTGNCVGLAGEVLSPGGTVNRLAKFIGGKRIGDSSIQDFFAGVSITIDNAGNIGIGTATPKAKLEVAGNLLADGNLLTLGMVGIGITNPQYPLHVSGRIQATGDICTDLGGGKCLSQLAPPSPPVVIERPTRVGIGGSGGPNYIPIWTSATTLGNSILSQSGSTLTLGGNMNITGLLITSGLKIATTTQAGYILVSADDQGNIVFAPPPPNVIMPGTKFLRASLPIFKYSNPAQTATTSFVEVSNVISTSTLAKILPPKIANSQRKFALLTKFADNIPQNASSTWRIDFQNLPDFDFEIQGQNLPSLETGILHLQDEIQNLANDNWVLKAKVPSSSYTLRIFNIFLLCYDEIQ
jgi:DNA-binding transcriptional MerR regulator